MVLKPNFKILGDIVFYNISTLTVFDSIYDESDAVTIVCDDFTINNSHPKIEILIGYSHSLWSVGSYILQSVNFTNNSKTLIFTSASFNDKMKQKKIHSYQKITLNELCEKIAARYNLKVKCDMHQFIEHIDQKNESDIALLNRYANRYNAIFNIKNNTLIFLSKISKQLPLFNIYPSMCSNYNITFNQRFLYKSVTVKYHNFKKNKIENITIGSGVPKYQIEEIQKNKTEAIDIGNAKLQKLIAKNKNGYITLEGQNLIAGAKVNILGFNQDIDGLYLINSVEHNIDSIFTSTISIEKLPE